MHYHGGRERAETTLDALDGEGHQLFQCDISDPDAAEILVESAAEKFGGLDVLVNNAGISQRHNFEDIDYATWQSTWKRIVDTNLTAAANLSFLAAKKMVERGGGRIVNVSSRGAFRGEPQMPWYGASKAGMNAMGQSLAQALGPRGVFVYTVAPGFVETEMAARVLASAGRRRNPQSKQHRPRRPTRGTRHHDRVPRFRGARVHDRLYRGCKRRVLSSLLVKSRLVLRDGDANIGFGRAAGEYIGANYVVSRIPGIIGIFIR